VSSYWTRRAVQEIAADPGAWLKLVARKLARAFDPGDPTDLYPLAIERRHWLPTLWLLPASTACLLLLAAIGCVVAWRERALDAWPLLALVGWNLAVQLAFFTDSRLRLPFHFFLVPLAGHAVAVSLRAWRNGRRLLPAVTGALAIVAAIGGTLALAPSDRDAVRAAAVLSSLDRLDESLAVLEPSLRTDDPDPSVLDQAGWVRHKRGDLEHARDLYLRAIERERSSARVRQSRSRLAAVYEKLGATDEARRQHDLAVAGGEPSPGALLERARFAIRQEDVGAARRDLARAIELAPGWAEPRETLAELDGGQ
jgi:Flp pilus assembly protein TadD